MYHEHPLGRNSSELKQFFRVNGRTAIPSVCIHRIAAKKGLRLGKPYTPQWQKKLVKYSVPGLYSG